MLFIPLIVCIVLSRKESMTLRGFFITCASVNYIATFLMSAGFSFIYVYGSSTPFPIGEILQVTFISGSIILFFSCAFGFLAFRKRIKRREVVGQ